MIQSNSENSSRRDQENTIFLKHITHTSYKLYFSLHRTWMFHGSLSWHISVESRTTKNCQSKFLKVFVLVKRAVKIIHSFFTPFFYSILKLFICIYSMYQQKSCTIVELPIFSNIGILFIQYSFQFLIIVRIDVQI